MAVEVTFEWATAAHSEALAQDMCDEDVAEVWASSRSTPLQSLENSRKRSDMAITAIFSGKPAYMAGVQAIDSGSMLGNRKLGIFWILTAKVTRQHPRHFVKYAHEVLDAFLGYCPVLVNWIDYRHRPALRMAKWLGMELSEPVPHGVNGEPFVPFVARRRHG